MSENTTSIDSPAKSEIPSTQGMTTRVVKGSLWTLGGTILPFAVTFFVTPFIIRLLGSEGYSLLLLIGLIPNYFVFADFGMSIASTKFGSEAYAQGLREKEGRVVRTAALIALIFSLPISIGLFFFSPLIVKFLEVSPQWEYQASVGLKITSLVFVVTILASIFNTPQLSRLRMDLNTLVNTVSRILLPLGTFFVLYFGFGIIGAAWAALFAISIGLLGHIFFSGRLLPELFEMKIDKSLVKPMIKYGLGLMLASIAVTTLANLEKFALTSLISVRSLGYYSIAYTFAYMATMFSASMIQSLIPAFSQLLEPEKKAQFASLFSKGVRLTLIWLFPSLVFLFVIAKPFFTVWAGEEFGRESSPPFYILLFGLFFHILACVPHSAIIALGRSDVFAKLYWIELLFFIPITIFLVNSFGINGAAAAWSLRASTDALVLIWLSRSVVKFNFHNPLIKLIPAVISLCPPVLYAAICQNHSILLAVIFPISFIFYSLLIWKFFIDTDEKAWIKEKFKILLKQVVG